jgi:uncharacterized RmlC-like cupin family protein
MDRASFYNEHWSSGVFDFTGVNTAKGASSMTSRDQETHHGSRSSPGSPSEGERIITVRPSEKVLSRQKLPYFVGISEATAGAKGLSMNLIIIPPGEAAEPHRHQGFETAIYLLEGRVETRYGKGLRHSLINEAGDFVFIPADIPHQPFNLSATKGHCCSK